MVKGGDKGEEDVEEVRVEEKPGQVGLPGQVAVQALFWKLCPSQELPPLRGVGLVQLRLLFCDPRPHTALQADHVDHVDQPPFTARPQVQRRGTGGGEERGRRDWG